MIGFALVLLLVAAAVVFLAHEWGYGQGWNDGYESADERRPAHGTLMWIPDDKR